MAVPTRTRRRTRVLAGVPALVVVAALVLPGPALAQPSPLDVGAAGLPEVRTSEVLAPGVQVESIVRGAGAAPVEEIATTALGPWRVAVLRVDPRVTSGRLVATYGPDLARTETTSSLVASSGALAGVNASFFTFGKNPAYPGDPIGLGLYDGRLLSEPGATSTEVDVLLDARTGAVRLGRTSWSGRIRNTRTKATLALEMLNSPPVVPKACARLKDPRRCTKSGDVVRFDRAFATRTPKGPGAEVVLGRDGCVVRASKVRGRKLTSRQSAVQATGRQAKTLLRVAKKGACLSTSTTLRDARGKTVKLRSGMYGVAGRYRLVQDGKVVVKDRTQAFFERNPRTLVGTSATGVVALVTIDGRQATSVGVTLEEAARVAVSLGLRDAVNLDGGGSTTMVAGGRLVNSPSHRDERAVGDALVYVPR